MDLQRPAWFDFLPLTLLQRRASPRALRPASGWRNRRDGERSENRGSISQVPGTLLVYTLFINENSLIWRLAGEALAIV